MARTHIHGRFALEQPDVERARTLPFLATCCIEDADSVVFRAESLNDIGIAASDYDAGTRTWAFRLDVLDDVLPNANLDPLQQLLLELPLLDGRGIIMSREVGEKIADWIVVRTPAGIIERNIVGRADDDDPTQIDLEAARTLVRELDWPVADALFESLTGQRSRKDALP